MLDALYPHPACAGPADAVPGARGVRDAGVRAQLPGRVALRRADTLRGILHADCRSHQVT